MPVTEVQTHIMRQIFGLTFSEFCYGWLTRYSESLWAWLFVDRVPAMENFRTSPHSPLYSAHRACFPGLKGPGSGVNHPPRSSSEVKETIEL